MPGFSPATPIDSVTPWRRASDSSSASASSIRLATSVACSGGQSARIIAISFQPEETGAEIDIIEYFGDNHPEGGLTSFIYSKNSSGKDVKTGSWIKNSTSFLKNRKDGWSKNYHVFSVEWTPSVYIFRIDGKETWRTKVGVSGQQQFPILSVLARTTRSRR